MVRVGKDEEPPAAVGLNRVAKMDRLSVSETSDRRGVKAHADGEAIGQMLMRRLCRDDRRGIWVSIPAVKRPCFTECSWNSPGSTPWLSASHRSSAER